MKISKYFQWMEVYINEAKRTHPKLNKVKKIYKIPFSYDKRQKALAMFTEYSDNSISLGFRLQAQDITFKTCNTVIVKPNKLSKIDLLDSLAHELAHVYHFLHTPKHKKLECRFKTRFMTMLEKEGYKSEEYELKTKVG